MRQSLPDVICLHGGENNNTVPIGVKANGNGVDFSLKWLRE